MSWKFLKNDNVKPFLEELASSAELYITHKEDEKWKFHKYENQEDISFPDNLIDESLKQHFFPKRRPIATFDLNKEWSLQKVDPNTQPRIFIGLHACDAAGIEYLDKVFMLSDYKDDLYIAERERTTLIGHICREMGEFCHCTDRGYSPDDESNFDVIFTEIENGYVFKGITEKGHIIMQSNLLVKTDIKSSVNDWSKDRYPVAPPEEILETYNDEFWKEMSDICLTCGSCTFECPTCVCFLISDEKHQGKGERVTVWDSCQNRSYSRMAGGHNPRNQNTDRVRNRTLDKFGYSYQKFGKISCVGCGRCVINCPLKRSFPHMAVKLSEHILEKKAQ